MAKPADETMEQILLEIEQFKHDARKYTDKLKKTESYTNSAGEPRHYNVSCGMERGILKARSLLLIRKLSAWRRQGAW